jgi:carboxyl-terminal processing protease
MAVLLGLLLAGALLLGPSGASALSDAQALVVDAWRLVSQGYVDPDQLREVHWRRLRQKALERPIRTSGDAYDAIDAMLAPLGDPYTRLLRPEDYEALRASTQGSLSGVGLQLGVRASDGRVVVIAPLEGSPAADAAIGSGSELISVNGVAVADLGLEATAARLRGEAGSQVVLRLRDPEGAGGAAREVTLERRQVDLRPVRTRRLRTEAHTLGYVRIAQFSEGVPEDVAQALADLRDKDIEGLVLDLRNNSGGLVEAGLAVADQLLDGGPIVETRSREGLSEVIPAHPGRLYDGPMVTLVNEGTASASEILAGALQDNDRSPLLGQRTFGKGLIQSLINLNNGSGLAVTVARYQTPSGRDIQDSGIVPNQLLADPQPLTPGGEDDHWLGDGERALLRQLESHAPPAP